MRRFRRPCCWGIDPRVAGPWAFGVLRFLGQFTSVVDPPAPVPACRHVGPLACCWRGRFVVFPRIGVQKKEEWVVRLRLRDNESVQEAVRRFRKLVEHTGVKKEMRRREYFEKPSEQKRRERRRAQRRARINNDLAKKS